MEVVKSFNPKEQKSSKLSLCTLVVGGCSFVMGIVAVVLRWGKFSNVSNSPRQNTYTRSFDPYKGTGYFGAFSAPCEFVSGSGGRATFCGPKVDFVPHPLLKFSGVCLLVGVGLSLLFCLFSLLGFAMEIQNKNICVKYIKSVTATVVLAVLTELAMLASLGLGVLQFILNNPKFSVTPGGGYIIVIILSLLNILLIIMSSSRLKRAKKSEFPKVSTDPTVYVIPDPDLSRPRPKGVLRGPSPTMDNGANGHRIRQPVGVLSMDPRVAGGSIGSFNMSAVSDTTSIGSAGSLQSNWSGRSGASCNSVKFSIQSEQTTL